MQGTADPEVDKKLFDRRRRAQNPLVPIHRCVRHGGSAGGGADEFPARGLAHGAEADEGSVHRPRRHRRSHGRHCLVLRPEICGPLTLCARWLFPLVFPSLVCVLLMEILKLASYQQVDSSGVGEHFSFDDVRGHLQVLPKCLINLNSRESYIEYFQALK